MMADPENASVLCDRAASGQRGDAAIFRPDRAVGELKMAAAESPTDPTYALGLIRGWQVRAIARGRSGSPSLWSARAPVLRPRSWLMATPWPPPANMPPRWALMPGRRT
ncbi:hypothetical protein GCM10020258_37010 [Sphingomonas yabuuchiae]